MADSRFKADKGFHTTASSGLANTTITGVLSSNTSVDGGVAQVLSTGNVTATHASVSVGSTGAVGNVAISTPNNTHGVISLTSGNVTVTAANTTITGTNITFAGNTVVSGNLHVTGTFSYNQVQQGHLVPSANNTYDLGSNTIASEMFWRNGYFANTIQTVHLQTGAFTTVGPTIVVGNTTSVANLYPSANGGNFGNTTARWNITANVISVVNVATTNASITTANVTTANVVTLYATTAAVLTGLQTTNSSTLAGATLSANLVPSTNGVSLGLTDRRWNFFANSISAAITGLGNTTITGTANVTGTLTSSGSLNRGAVVNASVSGTYTVDCAVSSVFILTLVGTTVLEVTNAPTGIASKIQIVIKQDGVGSRALTFGSSWLGGTADPAYLVWVDNSTWNTPALWGGAGRHTRMSIIGDGNAPNRWTAFTEAGQNTPINASLITSGTLVVNYGGTGVGTFGAGGIVYSAGGTTALSIASGAQVASIIGTNLVANATYATTAGSTPGNAGTATLATKASTLSQSGGGGAAMTFNWSGQVGQPSWLWGSNDGTNIYVYNPSNFNVNSAVSATSASTAGYATTAGGGWPTALSGFTNDRAYANSTNSLGINGNATTATTASSGWPTNLTGFTNGTAYANSTNSLGINGNAATASVAASGWPTALSGYTNDRNYANSTNGFAINGNAATATNAGYATSAGSATTASGGWPTNLTGYTNGTNYANSVNGYGINGNAATATSASSGWPTALSGYTNDRNYANSTNGHAINGNASTATSATNATYATYAYQDYVYDTGVANANYPIMIADNTVAGWSNQRANNTQLFWNPSAAVMHVQGSFRTSGDITAYYSSDRSLKENVTSISTPLAKILSIGGYEFDWTKEHIKKNGGEDGYYTRKHDIGVIAQEILAVLPEAVAKRDDGILAVRYEKIVPLLIEGIKELTAKIRDLESRIPSNGTKG